VADSKTKDWWARGLGIAGLFLGLVSFGWQVHTYRDSFAERVLVRLSMQSEVKGDESVEDAMKQEGKLMAEIVNIGQHPLYIRSVSLSMEPEREFGPGEDPSYWEFFPDNSKTPALEPGAAANYRINKFDFGKHPLDSAEDPTRKEDYVVIVESNAGEISKSPVSITGYSFYSNVPASIPPKQNRQPR
jgi:hypothetical protein